VKVVLDIIIEDKSNGKLVCRDNANSHWIIVPARKSVLEKLNELFLQVLYRPKNHLI